MTSKELASITHVSIRWIEKKCETGEIDARKQEDGTWSITELELQQNELIQMWLKGKGLLWKC